MAHDLATALILKSVGSSAGHSATCSRCRRTPLPGEMMHELESHKVVCQLCLARVPERERQPLRSDRVRASERRLAVVPRAA